MDPWLRVTASVSTSTCFVWHESQKVKYSKRVCVVDKKKVTATCVMPKIWFPFNSGSWALKLCLEQEAQSTQLK